MPVIPTGTIGTSAAAAMRAIPDRKRYSRPSVERVPSGKMPISAPARSNVTATSRALRSALPRSTGIMPMATL